jgi:tetratricopeptide (TPR) repeat protein
MNIQFIIPENFIALYAKYKTYIIAASVTIGLLVALAVYQYFEMNTRSESAQMALFETLQEFDKAVQMPDLWTDIEVASKTGYRQYKSTSIAPYFLLLQAQALAEQGKHDEALALMEEAINAIDVHSPLYYIASTKLARMQLDSTDEATKNKGFTSLEKLAQDQKNMQRDQALYFLGHHFKNQSDNAQAVSVWSRLIEEFKNHTISSPWAQLAQAEMQELV